MVIIVAIMVLGQPFSLMSQFPGSIKEKIAFDVFSIILTKKAFSLNFFRVRFISGLKPFHDLLEKIKALASKSKTFFIVGVYPSKISVK